MAVFLHFGKEISDMMVKHISIEVTSKQTKKPVFGGPADLTAYILEPVDGILDKEAGCAALPRRRIPYTFYQKTSPSL